MIAKNFINRAGQKIGHWLVVSLDKAGTGPTTWLCRCNLCGIEKVWRFDAIHLQKFKSRHLCECRVKEKELAKSIKMSLARTGKSYGPAESKSDTAALAELRDQNGRSGRTKRRAWWRPGPMPGLARCGVFIDVCETSIRILRR
jgi:hypothetical protein